MTMTDPDSAAPISSSYAHYVEGTELGGGKVIEHVYARARSYVIYQLKGSRCINYSWNQISPEQHALMQRLEMLGAKAQKKFKGVRFGDTNHFMVAALQAIFREDCSDSAQRTLKEFETYIAETAEVKSVIARTPDFIVWINSEARVDYYYRKDLPGVEDSVAEFTRLRALGTSVLPASTHGAFHHRLGAALATSLRLQPGSDTGRIFEPIEGLIQSILENDLRIKYLLATTAGACILVSLTYIIYRMADLPIMLHDSLVAVSGGFIGALISVLERSKTLRGTISESSSLITFQGVLRILLGGTFGFIAFAAAKAGLAFSILNTTTASMIVLGVAAGFSERLIPELIESIYTAKEKS